MVTVKHSGNIGDIIYSLPAIRQASRLHDKIDLLLLINQLGQLAYNHPLGNVMLNREVAEMAVPFFESLDFIKSVRIITEPEPVDYDLDRFRKIGLNYTGHISRWYFYVYPELTCDLAEPIFFPKGKTDRPIVINRTNRYHGRGWDYLLFRKYDHLMTFVGLPDEFAVLSKKLPNMDYKPVNDFYELAQIITGSDLFIGNQSMAFAIAEVTKTNRALEVCPDAHNVIPTGRNGYDCYSMQNLKYILDTRIWEKIST